MTDQTSGTGNNTTGSTAASPSLIERAEAIAKRIVADAEALGHEALAEVEKLLGIEPQKTGADAAQEGASGQAAAPDAPQADPPPQAAQ